MNRGIISKIFDWGTHPNYDNTTAFQWFAGLVFILILAFLWSTVINGMREE